MLDTRPRRMLIGFNGGFSGSSSTYVYLGQVGENTEMPEGEVLSFSQAAGERKLPEPLFAAIERVGRSAGLLGARFTPDPSASTLTVSVRVGTTQDRWGIDGLARQDAQAALDGLAEVASGPAMQALGAGRLEIAWARTHDVDSSAYGFRDLASKLVPLLTLQPDASENDVWRAWRHQGEMIRLGRVLDYLDTLQIQRPRKCRFKPGATSAQIAALEDRIGLPLPDVLRTVLLRANGGRFLPSDEPTNDIDVSNEEEPTAKVDCELLSTEEIAASYVDLIASHEAYVVLDGWRDGQPVRPRYITFQGAEVPWSYIPVARTVEGQELVVLEVFRDPEYANRVQDAFHELGPVAWGILYERYVDLFEDFIASAGIIKTIA